MFTKTIEPIIDPRTGGNGATGTIIKYRIFGILVCKKTLYLPSHYGLKHWEFIHRF